MTRNSLRRHALGAALVVLAACTAEGGDKPAAAAARGPQNPDPAQTTFAPALGVALPAFYKTQLGTYYQDVTPGTGTVSIPGRKAKVRYTGWLPDGTKFDSGEIEFTPGAGEVIKGWDDGVAGMKVGGKRKLVIPAALGYGEAGSPPDIPPNAVLVFDVELLAVG
jgi:FKBP-type peptidyl-prolyl cis-trans isomerase